MTNLPAAEPTVRRLTVADGLLNNQVRQVVELPNGQIFVATEGMFSLYNGREFRPVECRRDSLLALPQFGCHSHLWQGDSLLWLKDFHSLYLFDTRQRRFRYDYTERLKEHAVARFVEENGDSVTKVHVEQLAPLRPLYDSLTAGTLIQGEWLQSYCRDRQGGQWWGVQNGGLLYLRPRRPMACLIPTERGDGIRRMATIDRNRMLVASARALRIYDCQQEKYVQTLATGDIHCSDISTDTKGRIWISTQLGLFCYAHGETSTYDTRTTTGFPHHHMRFALPLDDGRILVCVINHHLGYLYPEEHRFELLNERVERLNDYRTMVAALPLKDPHKVLVCTQNGLFVLDTEQNAVSDFPLTKPFERFSSKYNCILRDRRGRIWIGTQNGLLVTDGNETKRITEADGLSNACIQSLVEDGEGRICAGTSFGINRVSLSPTSTEGLHILSLSVSDGIPSVEMTERGATIMPDGTAYFASPEGVCVLHTTNFSTQRATLPTVLVGLKVMGREMPLDTLPLHLDYRQNYLEIQFSALNYAAPEHTRYRYRLQGSDAEWQYANDGRGLGTALYNALPHGQYTFEVQAAIDGGPWGPLTRKRVVVHPPLWLTWWAKAIMTLIGMAASISLIGIYLQRKRRRLEAENDDRVNRLFELREEARHRFAQSVDVDPSQIGVGKEEEELVERIMKCISQNMDNADYTIDLLAQDIGMSRANLYKKMQTMLGITPNNFLRNVRLKHAALLLTTSAMPVNQIAQAVGYQTPHYFSQCFRKMFGVSPNEYREGKTEEKN